jgi:hypothetical protein
MKVTNKMKLDVETMHYFYPRTGGRPYVKQSDREVMAIYSATGKKPQVETKGFKQLKWGKTYRDEQITSYKRDIRAGYFTKHELVQSMPPVFREWLYNKIKDVSYDEQQQVQPMLIKAYRSEQ